MRRGQVVALVLAVMLAITVLDAVLLVATGRAATATTTTTTRSTTSSSSTTIDYQIPNGLCLSCYYAPDPTSRTYRKVPAGTGGAVVGGSLVERREAKLDFD